MGSEEQYDTIKSIMEEYKNKEPHLRFHNLVSQRTPQKNNSVKNTLSLRFLEN